MLKYAGLTALLLGSALPLHAETIGVAMARADSTFLTLLLGGIKDRAGAVGSVTLQVEDGQNDVSHQLDQVQNLIAAGVDAIIVTAVDAAATPGMTKMATEAGIPLVYVNHPPADLDTLPAGTGFVGSNELDSGTMETQEVCRLLGGKGNVYVLEGPLSNEAALRRTEDIKAVIATPACSGMTIIDTQVANWDRLEAANIMTNWLTSGQEFQAVIANNDEMAIGAIQSVAQSGQDVKPIVFAGIDATPDGLAAMKAGDLDVTVFQDAHGQGAAALDLALALHKGEAADQKVWIPFKLVTPQTIEAFAN